MFAENTLTNGKWCTIRVSGGGVGGGGAMFDLKKYTSKLPNRRPLCLSRSGFGQDTRADTARWAARVLSKNGSNKKRFTGGWKNKNSIFREVPKEKVQTKTSGWTSSAQPWQLTAPSTGQPPLCLSLLRSKTLQCCRVELAPLCWNPGFIYLIKRAMKSKIC